MNRRLFALALVLDLVGAGAAVLITSRTWQSITVARPRPLADVTVDITGRDLDGGMLAAALVALVGVVAILATKGIARQIVGVIVALAGGLLAWRALANTGASGPVRAIQLVTAHRSSVGISASSPVQVTVHTVWPVLTVVAAALVIVAGVLVVIYGARWSSMSTRYEAPGAQATGGEEAMWTALDRGDDPTIRTES